jgi:hypothetical protein
MAPVVDMLVPEDSTANPPPSFLTRAQQVAGKMGEYIRQTVQDTVGQLLGSVQAFNPGLDLKPVAKGMPEEYSEEEFQALVDKLAPIADDYMKSLAEE